MSDESKRRRERDRFLITSRSEKEHALLALQDAESSEGNANVPSPCHYDLLT